MEWLQAMAAQLPEQLPGSQEGNVSL
jgi:hypothetical protein